MRLFSKTTALLCAAVMILSLAGCGQAASSAGNTTDPASVTSASSTESSGTSTAVSSAAESRASVYPMTITDSFGNEVTLDAAPQRVVSVGPSITENLFALGVGDRIVGRTDYCDFPEAALSIPSVGAIDAPNVETIVSLSPDLVIASSIFTEDSYSKLTELGIKVIILHNEYDVTGVYETLETLGAIMDAQDAAAALSEEMQSSITDTTAKIAGLAAPTVYYVLGYGEYGDYTSGGDTYIGTLLTLAGGNNIAQNVSGWSYSLESLIEADPDIIVLPAGMKADFIATDNYKDLSAVKNGKVYEIDRNLVERQGYRNADGIRALAQIFYPEAFAAS